MPKISIIVPVYNAEQWLERCIDSIVAQTYTDWELLLIDDGSTDASGDICDRYAASDPRIQAFHKPNGGVSSARNLGLDHAKGEWITFVDSDDYIEARFLESFSECFDADLIIGNAKIIENNEGTYYNKRLPSGLYFDLNEIVTPYLTSSIYRAPWAKMYSLKTVKTLRFATDFIIGEDYYFNLHAISKIKSIRILEGKLNNDNYIYSAQPCKLSEKYSLSVKSAVSCILKMNIAYQDINIKSIEFENDLINDYFDYCSIDYLDNGTYWYRNKEIRRLCFRRASNIGKFQLLKTWLVFSFLYPIKIKLAKKKNSNGAHS